MDIEDTIFETGMPVNSLAAANRLMELLRGLDTNCLKDVKENPAVRRLMWFLNQQVFGEAGTIDMTEEWHRLLAEKEAQEGRTA